MQPAELNDSGVALAAGGVARDGVLSRALRLERLARDIMGLEVRAKHADAPGDVRMVAKVLVLNDLGEVLLLHDTHTDRWDLPGGHLKDGEVPADGAVREVLEETGLRVAVGQAQSRAVKYGGVEKAILVYKAAVSGQPELALSGEHRGARWITPREAVAHLPLDAYRDIVAELAGALVGKVRSSAAGACPNTHDGQHVWETLEDGRALCFECDAVKASELGQVHNPEGHNQWTVGDLAMRVHNTAAVKEWKRHLNDYASYVLKMTPEQAHKTLDDAHTLWTETLGKVRRIAEGKEEVVGWNLENLRYHEGQRGKVLSGDEWANEHAIPDHERMLKELGLAKRALVNLQKRHAQESAAREVEAVDAEFGGDALRASEGAYASGHPFWGNQWTKHALHPEGDPVGEPSGKIKHAVLVIGGKRYKGPSHFQALLQRMEDIGGQNLEDARTAGAIEGFETESGHFLNRHQAALYVDSKRPAFHGLKRLESEDLPLAAVDGLLYTQDAVQASDEDAGEEHAAVRREVAGEYRKTVGKVMGALETEALMAQRRRDSKREKRKRREGLLGAVALLLLYAGVKAFRATRLRLAILQGQALGGVDRTPAPPSSREGGISAPEGDQSASGGQQGAPGAIVAQGEEGDGAEAFAESRAKLLEPFALESLDALEEEARGARTQAEMVAQVHRRAREIEDTRGGLVADTETMAAYGVAQWQLLASAGFETKVWRTMRDDKVRPSHLLCESQGEVHLTKEFHNGMMYPGDPRGGPEGCINCRCWLEGGRRIPGTGHFQASEPQGKTLYEVFAEEDRVKAGEPFTESLHPRDAAGKFADKRGMVPVIRVGDQPKEISRGGKTITRMLGGKWQLKSGGDLPEHFAKIAIPPAWKSAHVHLDPKTDYHAVGIDEAGRLQKVQSEAMKDKQAALKFARNAELMRKAEKVKGENDRNLESQSETVRESAACLRLIMETGIRPGGEEDTGAAMKAYGATTLEGRHVVEQDGKVRLEFIGKKGVRLSIPVESEDTAKMLLKRKEAAGDKGRVFGINANMLREYAHTLDGGSFKPKDFRTLRGTMIAVAEIDRVQEKPKDHKSFRKVVMEIAKIVAASLGNTPVIALQSYVNPAVWAKLRPEA